MPCGFCSNNGHVMRNCDSHAARNLLATYRVTARTVRSEEGMNIFLRSFTSDMLSIIMYSYGARSVSISRAAKEQYIREKILEERAQATAQGQPAPPPILIQAPPIVSPTTRQVIINQNGNHVTRVLEPMSVYKARMKTIADTLFDVICVTAYGITAYGITRYTLENYQRFLEMLRMLSQAIMLETNNSVQESVFLAKIITKKFRINTAIAEQFKLLFHQLIIDESTRIRIMNLPPRALIFVPQHSTAQLYMPHVPKFEAIKMCNSLAKEAEDYTCGICFDDFTQKTIATLGCEHNLCCECIVGQIKARTKSCIKCPYCREEVHQISVEDTTIRNQISKVVANEIAKK